MGRRDPPLVAAGAPVPISIWTAPARSVVATALQTERRGAAPPTQGFLDASVNDVGSLPKVGEALRRHSLAAVAEQWKVVLREQGIAVDECRGDHLSRSLGRVAPVEPFHLATSSLWVSAMPPKLPWALCVVAAFALGVSLWWMSSGVLAPEPSALDLPTDATEGVGQLPARAAAPSQDDGSWGSEDSRVQVSAASDGPAKSWAADWEALPRHTSETFDVVAVLRNAPHHVNASDILRHSTLNPRQRLISQLDAESLRQMLLEAQVRIAPMAQQRDAVRVREVELAKQAGNVETHGDGQPLPRAVSAEGGVLVTSDFSSMSGFVVPASAMPASTHASRLISAEGRALGLAIVQWCLDKNLLDLNEAGSLRRSIDQP